MATLSIVSSSLSLSVPAELRPVLAPENIMIYGHVYTTTDGTLMQNHRDSWNLDILVQEWHDDRPWGYRRVDVRTTGEQWNGLLPACWVMS